MKNIINFEWSYFAMIVWLVCSTPVFAQSDKDPTWDFNATVIEACSCPMFCPCFFKPQPAGHPSRHGGHGEEHGEMEHFCRFNIAYHVNEGSYNGVSLNDVEYWFAGDLGADFSEGKTEWAALTFDPAVTEEQREGIKSILSNIYPLEWKSFEVAEDADMKWEATNDKAVASLDNGNTAEIVLQRQPGMTDEPVVIQNIRYTMVPRNDGIILMPNVIEAYKVGDKAFEFKGSTGFMVTLDMTSEDLMESH